MVRRLHFLIAIIWLDWNIGLQIYTIQFFTLVFLGHIVYSNRVHPEKSMLMMDSTNELIFYCIITMHYCYTDWVADEDTKMVVGIFQNYFLIAMLVINSLYQMYIALSRVFRKLGKKYRFYKLKRLSLRWKQKLTDRELPTAEEIKKLCDEAVAKSGPLADEVHPPAVGKKQLTLVNEVRDSLEESHSSDSSRSSSEQDYSDFKPAPFVAPISLLSNNDNYSVV